METNQAKLIISYNAQLGELPDPVNYDAGLASIQTWATEAVHSGIPGITADPTANFTDFVVDRYPATDDIPYNRLMLRPKVPFGA